MRSFFLPAATVAASLVSSPALAAPPVVQAVQVGSETVRYDRGVPTLDLRKERGAVQIRPLAMDHGSLAFSVAVFNDSDTPANVDVTNFIARANGQSLGVFTVTQLVRKAENRAMWGQVGLALVGGLSAAAAANQRDTYRSTFVTPRGGVYRSTFSAPSAVGQVQAMAITAGTGVGIAAIQSQLDRTREALGYDVVQLSTVDPGQSYAGKIVLHKIGKPKLPQRVDITVTWNGEEYPFAFQLAKEGTTAPVFSVLTQDHDASSAAAPAPEVPAPSEVGLTDVAGH